ncbi:unnamed protein product [Ectocarpus sp. 6 AP-2014]
MSLAKKGRKAVRAFTRLIRRIVKWLLRKLTAQSEIGRILRSDGHSSELVQAIARSIARSSSSEVERVKRAVFGKAPFDVTSTCDELMAAKAIGDEHKPRLTWCLQVLNIVNIVHEKVETLRHTNYDPADATHVALLETLWTSLQPDARRTDGWAPLGFQNGDKPETDFRGMGLLGLHQLVFFAEARNREALCILADSINPKRYFPFAAAGINITAFTTTMLEQRRLDTSLYEAVVKHMPAGTLPVDEEMLVAAGLTGFNHVYGDEYVEFSRFWHESEPDSTMAFPGIFGTIKQRSNARFPPLVDAD